MSDKNIFENSKKKLAFWIAIIWSGLTISLVLLVWKSVIDIERLDFLYKMWMASYAGILAYMGLNIGNNITHYFINQKYNEVKKND